MSLIAWVLTTICRGTGEQYKESLCVLNTSQLYNTAYTVHTQAMPHFRLAVHKFDSFPRDSQNDLWLLERALCGILES